MNKEVKWEKHMPRENPLEDEETLDTRLAKKTRSIEYLDYWSSGKSTLKKILLG